MQAQGKPHMCSTVKMMGSWRSWVGWTEIGGTQPGRNNDGTKGAGFWLEHHEASCHMIGMISSCKSSSGRDHRSTRSCLNNALTRQIHHKSITDNHVRAVSSRLLLHIPSLQSHPSCLVFLPHPDSFFSVKSVSEQSPAVSGEAAWLLHRTVWHGYRVMC